ncbi:MAG: BadF/BadG/BcrA/BcrD ATPase family protein [Rubrivivax sp.]|nr:BadF/BadG/BcrA/BcrD ATPase family protein [Rubrivivax sp.]
MVTDTPTPTPPPAGLGLDAGGTRTRWALGGADGALIAQGQAAGWSGLQLDSTEGRAQIAATLGEIARASGPVRAVVAGVTGFDATQGPAFCALAASAFGVAPAAVRAFSDIELACHAAFAPGEGYVVYAGTGSVAAFIDAQGALHRAGGRGVVIDDAGGGHWIARQALRQIWRAEDEAPGAWQASPLARRVFEQIGGSDWAATRRWAYGASRGELGTLALAVAAAAEDDPAALALLHEAGRELARLGAALTHRFGPRPLALAGRVFELHPAIEQNLRAALPAGSELRRSRLPAHHTAARLAAQRTTP